MLHKRLFSSAKNANADATAIPLPGGGSLNRIAERTVSRSPLRRHPRKNRHEVIDIVDDENLCFTSMLPVKPTDILGQRARPGNGHRQEQRVKE